MRLPVKRVATERRRARVRKQRDFWFKHRFPAVSTQTDRIVFIDETSVKTNLTRQRGWSRRGERLVMDAPFGSWGTQTFIAGLSVDALDRAMGDQRCDGWQKPLPLTSNRCWCQSSKPGTVVILDDLATHKNAAAAKAMREAGCWFLFLPPYSPDLNPIEMAFSKLKAHLRRISARTFIEMFHALTEICDLFSPEKCWNYFKAAGYVSS